MFALGQVMEPSARRRFSVQIQNRVSRRVQQACMHSSQCCRTYVLFLDLRAGLGFSLLVDIASVESSFLLYSIIHFSKQALEFEIRPFS